MKKGLFLLGILLFPSIIYLLFSLGEHHVQKLGAFGDYEVNTDGDTVYAPVPELHLNFSNGETKSLRDLKGRAIILNFFKFPCEEDCKKKGATLANYLIELAEPEKWCILNVNLNSDATTHELAESAKAHSIGMDNWFFASMVDSTEANVFLEYVFLKNEKANNISNIPNDYFVMIDQNQIVREFFDSRIYKENRKMEDAIKLVLKEPHMSWKSK